MKNQYVGDASDYLKYAFLRALQAARKGPLMVCWMLTPDDRGPDGERLGYLKQPKTYREADPELFDTLGDIVRRKRRSVAEIEAAGLLPRASFFSRVIPDQVAQRQRLFEDLERETPADALVFFDADNGIEVKSKPKGRKDSSKYVFWDELESIGTPGRSLVIFQHYRRTPREAMVRDLLAELQRRIPNHRSFAVHGPHVVYLVAAPLAEEATLKEAAVKFSERKPWKLTLQECPAPPRSPIPEAVISSFVAGREAREGDCRSAWRRHDTGGEMLFLMRGSSPLAARWADEGGVRVDVLNSVAPDTDALIATHCERIGAQLKQVVEWQLINASRKRTVPSDDDS